MPQTNNIEKLSFDVSEKKGLPLVTFPKTQCLPSSQSVLTVHRKNWELFVFGPALAIDRVPAARCLSWKSAVTK